MHLFFATGLFFLAVASLAYLPGKVLLLFLKRNLSPLEDVSLASTAGLLMSGLVYWLMVFCHQGRIYLLWPITSLTFFLFLQAIRWKTRATDSANLVSAKASLEKTPSDGSGSLLSGIIALGIGLLALLPQYGTNLTLQKNGTIKIHAVSDVFFHLAIANELTHSIPPQAPVFAGRPLNYHYGMDLAVAMFANATGLPTEDLLLRFMPALFLTLSILSVFCFARAWLNSGYFGALSAFLVFFGEDFSFIPGFLLGEKADWSVYFFRVPAVLSLFYTNAMLPAVGLLFAGFFCLQRYLRERTAPWLILSAVLFVGLVEVKLFTAAQIMFCLGLGAITYGLVFRTLGLFRIAGLTAILTIPFVLSVFLHNRGGARFVTTFAPSPYVSIAMTAMGLKNWFANTFAFAGIALPLYLIGCLGLRIIGIRKLWKAIVIPTSPSGLRFVLALFVLTGLVIALTCRIVPADATNAYNNSVWFLAQSKYVMWLFAVEVLQDIYRRFVIRGRGPAVVAFTLTTAAVALSIPSTIQHFLLESDPSRIYGLSIDSASQSYSKDVIEALAHLKEDAQPGDVVLPDGKLLGPVLALTKCRVPLGYFAAYLVSRNDLRERGKAERLFWRDWKSGRIRDEILKEANVRYIILNKQLENVPPVLPSAIVEIFANSECALFRVTL